MFNRNSVIIKSNAYGLILILDEQMPFDQLLMDIGEKFSEASRFFKNAQMAITFRGRVLSREEERVVLRVITDNTTMHIICVVDEQKEEEDYYKEAVTRFAHDTTDQNGQFYEGTLKNGEVFESDSSVIILGNVNPGAKVIAKGNIIVLGCCMGTAQAGSCGDKGSFIAALILKPRELRIADKVYRSAITKRIDTGEYSNDPKIAYIFQDQLRMDQLKGSMFDTVIPAARAKKENVEVF